MGGEFWANGEQLVLKREEARFADTTVLCYYCNYSFCPVVIMIGTVLAQPSAHSVVLYMTVPLFNTTGSYSVQHKENPDDPDNHRDQ